MAHTRNDRLAAVIARAGLSHGQVARAFVRAALEAGAHEYAGVGRSHMSHWVGGSKPSGRGPSFLCEALSRCLGRVVTLEEIGLTGEPDASGDPLDWHADTLLMLTDLGRVGVAMERRRLLGASAYSVAALALPGEPWWAHMADRGRTRSRAGTQRASRWDVEAVRDMTDMFSRIDQRRGGGHARMTVARYLRAWQNIARM